MNGRAFRIQGLSGQPECGKQSALQPDLRGRDVHDQRKEELEGAYQLVAETDGVVADSGRSQVYGDRPD